MTREKWTKHVERWRESGLSAPDYAQQEELNASTLRWWSSRLRRDGTTLPTFVEVAIGEAVPASCIEVAIGERVCVRVRRGFDAELLRQVVTALEGR